MQAAQSATRTEAQYVGHPKQVSFHQARNDYRRRWFVGGRQSGKTEAGAVEAALHALEYGGQGAIFAPSYPHAIVARQRFEHFVPFRSRTWNGQDRVWKIKPTGAVVHLRSLSDPDAPRGLTLDWAWLDECAMYSEKAWQNARATMAVKGARIWGTSTPRGMNWLWKQAQQNPEPGVDFLVHARSIDNPHFPAEEWDAVKKRYGVDSAFFKQEYLGLFTAFEGQAVPMFDRTKHARPVDWVPSWPVVRGMDFGWFPAPTVLVTAQIDPDMKLILRGCRTWLETPRVVVLRQLDCGHIKSSMAGPYCIDPSGAQGRAKESGDRGWQQELEQDGHDVQWTRKVGEAAGLQMIRRLVHEDRLIVDTNGPGAELLIEAFETAESSKKPEKDELADQHPQADILDAIRYIVVNAFPMDPALVARKM